MGPHEASAPETLHCYRHPDRETLLSCSSCDRPICTSCMTQAAVGMRCPECAGRRSARVRAPRPRGVAATSGAPVATITLVAINVLLFLVEMAQGVAVRGVSGSQLVDEGSIYGPAIADGEWWRMITGGFLHAGLIHIAFNMYLLWILGGALERFAGS
ncbi:MAG: rhomboid family intramembrane serine protease, partial [Thermoleophilia bacterium]